MGKLRTRILLFAAEKIKISLLDAIKVLTVVQYGTDCVTNVIHGTEFDTCSITWISFASIFVFAGNICSIGTTLSHNLLLLLQIL